MKPAKTWRRLALVGLITCSTALPPARSGESAGALREFFGTVQAIEQVKVGEDSTPWIEIVLQGQDQESLRARVAPVAVLDESGFELKPGQRVRIRVFVEETPPGTSRLRNMDSGQVIRLRCLHGEPLWAYRGVGAHPPTPQQQHGAEHRGRR